MQFLQANKMTPHTTESLMEALGLDPNFKGVPGAPPGRALGHTTKMLIAAAIELQHGKVAVLGHNFRQTVDLNAQLETICLNAGISAENLIGPMSHNLEARPWGSGRFVLRDNPRCTVFKDHFYGGEHSLPFLLKESNA